MVQCASLAVYAGNTATLWRLTFPAKIANKYAKHQFRTNPLFRCLHDFYHNLSNGLDSDRFCVPEHIIDESNAFLLFFVTFSAKACVEYLRSEA